MEIDGIEVASEDFFRRWLNAEEYHHDREKREAFASIANRLPPDTCTAMMQTVLRHKVELVLWLADVVES